MGKSTLSVPVGAVLYPQIHVCPSGCTERMGDVTVQSVQFHMHGQGRMIALRLIRDGHELEPLAVIENFAVGFTEKAIPINREIMAGDSIILECY